MFFMDKKSQSFLITVGANIKRTRMLKGMTHSGLALLCETEKANMSRIEAGRQNITLLTLLRIGTALDAPVGELMIEEGSAL